MTDPNPLLHQTGSSTKTSSFDHCSIGWAQIFQATLVSFAWFFDAQQTFISVFTDASTISEWSLQRSGSLITGLPASSFLSGCLVGGFALATLADSSIGRKNLLLLSTLLMSLASLLTSLSPNLPVYSFLRFLSGFGRSTIGTCALVLATELVGPKHTDRVGILGFTCFTLGFLSLPAIAFSLKSSSWRLMYVYTSLPSLLYSLSVFFLVRESPRWLRLKETMSSPDIFSAVRMLAERRWGIRRLGAVMVVGFGIGMIYYGMPLGLGSLKYDNLYLGVTMNALSELPASLVTFFLIGRLGRKGFVFGLAVLSGVCSVGCVVVRWEGMQMGLELVSFFGACTAFDVVLIYTMEMFPTCVRNSAVAMVRQALVLGGAVSPVVVAAGNGVWSYGVFGATIAVCGVFVVFLPETRGEVMCDTMEEEEERMRISDGVCCV